MNLAEAPKDDEAVLRLMRESDTLGAESSLWLRAFRQLTQAGKPVGSIIALTIPIGDGKNMPIAMLTLTRKRLVFWPVLPRRPCVVVGKPDVPLPDHISVDFPSEKVHVTSYGADGEPLHVREAWRSAPYDVGGLRLLFTFLVRRNVVAEQDVLVTRKVRVPTSDKDRRTAEMARCIRRVVCHHLPVPGIPAEQDFVYLSLFSASQLMTAETVPSSLLPRPAVHDSVTGWPDNAEFQIVVGQFSIRDQWFCVPVGCPPGRLKDEIYFGFPLRPRASA